MKHHLSWNLLAPLIAWCAFSSQALAAEDPIRCRFGVLQLLPNGDYAMGTETKRIPRYFEATGFRWGIAFDNPGKKKISWYEIVRLPSGLKQLSGDLSGIPTIAKSEVQHSSDADMVDQFWFDPGDPLGIYSIELYVNDVRKCTIWFEVIEPEALK